MTIQEVFQKITDISAAVGKEQADFTNRLNECRRDKEKAEAAKAAALSAKDEQGYMAACRALADAEAGIEFNTMCLHTAQTKKHASDQENDEIIRELRKASAEIYKPTLLTIEKALETAVEAAEAAEKKYEAIDEMGRSWKMAVMNDHNERSLAIAVSGDYSLALAPLAGKLKTSLSLIKMGKKENPLFKEGKGN